MYQRLTSVLLFLALSSQAYSQDLMNTGVFIDTPTFTIKCGKQQLVQFIVSFEVQQDEDVRILSAFFQDGTKVLSLQSALNESLLPTQCETVTPQQLKVMTIQAFLDRLTIVANGTADMKVSRISNNIKNYQYPVSEQERLPYSGQRIFLVQLLKIN